jgi:hypothetical protein
MCIEARHWFFQDYGEERLKKLACKTRARGLTNEQFAVIAVDMYDPFWIDFTECLKQNRDCQEFQDQNGVAFAWIKPKIIKKISLEVPDIEPALECSVPPNLVRAVIMAEGGASVYFIDPNS